MLSEGDFSGLPVIPLDWPPIIPKKLKKWTLSDPSYPARLIVECLHSGGNYRRLGPLFRISGLLMPCFYGFQ